MKLNHTIRSQDQLELTFVAQSRSRRFPHRRRQTQARLWFNRMRQIVENATDWRPASPPRPVQPLLGKVVSAEYQLAE